MTIELPALLADVLGARRLHLRAATLGDALEEAYRRLPALRSHLCDESGAFREHVLCFLNGDNTTDLAARLRPGDRIVILQAVSGG